MAVVWGVGWRVEIVGIALEKGAVQVQKAGSLSAQAMTAARATARVGNVFVRAGGVLVLWQGCTMLRERGLLLIVPPKRVTARLQVCMQFLREFQVLLG